MRTYETFDSWEAVLAFVEQHGYIYYQAPLDHKPHYVSAGFRGQKVRVTPTAIDVDSFWADASHLDRFRRPIDTMPFSTIQSAKR